MSEIDILIDDFFYSRPVPGFGAVDSLVIAADRGIAQVADVLRLLADKYTYEDSGPVPIDLVGAVVSASLALLGTVGHHLDGIGLALKSEIDHRLADYGPPEARPPFQAPDRAAMAA